MICLNDSINVPVPVFGSTGLLDADLNSQEFCMLFLTVAELFISVFAQEFFFFHFCFGSRQSISVICL